MYTPRLRKVTIIRYSAILFSLLIPILYAPASGKEAKKPDLLQNALQAMGGAEEIVFAVRPLCAAPQPTVTFGRFADAPLFAHAPDGSKLCKLNMRTKQVAVLLDAPKGGIRDPRVHYDGGKLLFSYRKGGTHHYNLYEINTDGSGLRQLTFGEWDDVDPAYLPDGGIVFVSTRGRRFVPCQRFQAGLIYRMDADGRNMLCLSANNVADDRPAVLPDGRIIYTRWEYVDRHPQRFRDLWVMNPDGTGQRVYYGPVRQDYYGKCDALPIPGTNKLVSIFSMSLGHRDNAGNVMIVDPRSGPDDWSAAKQISPKIYSKWFIGLGEGREGFRDPYPLSEDCFLVAINQILVILGGDGKERIIFHGKDNPNICRPQDVVHDPRVIRSRPREPVILPRIDLKKTTGQFILADIYRGRHMQGVKPGDIKKLLVLEDLPKPVSYQNIGYNTIAINTTDATLTVRRILGTVPVEPDGSASFKAPPMRGLYFVALDEKGVAVKRMQSYTMIMPGETQGCVGCHEPRTETPGPAVGNTLMALKRPPSRIERVSHVPEVIDYPRDVQPIWNRHCVECHNAEKPSGRAVLTDDKTEWFTQSYVALCAHDQVAIHGIKGQDGNNPPWGYGTSTSPLMQKIDGSHYDVKLTKAEHDMVRLWIESSAVFSGTYAVYNHTNNAVAGLPRVASPTVSQMARPVGPIVKHRCMACHATAAGPGHVKLTKHYQSLYNLSHPEKSMILMAPLAKAAGGYGWCKTKDARPATVFRDTQDPHYQVLLQTIQAAKARQQQTGRIDIPGSQPNEHYVRWMKRFGILPKNFDPAKDHIDPFETDNAYWRSLWHHPPQQKLSTKF